MSAAAIVTLIGVGLLVVALAGYLVWAALLLRHVSATLGTIVDGLQTIADRTEPLDDVVGQIVENLEVTADALEDVLARHEDVPSQRETSEPA